MNWEQHLDGIIRDWEFDPLSCRFDLSRKRWPRCDSDASRLGVLQMETQGRPDGTKPNGRESYLDVLLEAEKEDADFEMDEDHVFRSRSRIRPVLSSSEISWLRLQQYHRAVEDADHTLALMDVCRDHSPDEEWTIGHEQYRPFVLFHRTQAAALAALEASGPSQARRGNQSRPGFHPGGFRRQ